MVKEKVKDVERKVGFTILSRVNKVWKIIKCHWIGKKFGKGNVIVCFINV